jgi:hypothetical protein
VNYGDAARRGRGWSRGTLTAADERTPGGCDPGRPPRRRGAGAAYSAASAGEAGRDGTGAAE